MFKNEILVSRWLEFIVIGFYNFKVSRRSQKSFIVPGGLTKI